jgi:tRNA 2-selenouridine synthase
VLDLERLARHRGSVLGQLPSSPQPSQKAFENQVWDTLRRFDPARPVFVESESKKVGQLRVPGALMDTMRAAPCISLQLSAQHRVQLLMQDYAHFTDSPLELNGQLEHLVSLHGREKIKRWQQMAIAGRMPELVAELLAEHYDPAYLRSIDRNFVHFKQARVLELGDISPHAFAAAAAALQAD